ncbi:MAG: type II secretion system protein [Candidatus Gastranaerophilales bacterium]|nr:type II secretion system protein [Candidatus Gastranaerophilales bacterium]
MKKGFSLPELLICLLVMGVIASMIAPSLTDLLPNKKKYLFKSAYKIVEQAVAELIQDDSIYPDGDFENATDATFFCDNFTSKVNTVSTVDCSQSLTAPDDEANFMTSNGQKWWGFYTTFATDPATVYVDVNGDSGDNTVGEDILRIDIYKNGKITVTETPETDYLLAQ